MLRPHAHALHVHAHVLEQSRTLTILYISSWRGSCHHKKLRTHCKCIVLRIIIYPVAGMTESTGAVDPPNKCICHICKLVACDPQQVTCCSNIYCKTCLQQLKDKGSEFNCPTCRKPLTGNYFKDGRAEREIKSLRVYCSNTDSGCQL